MVTLEWLKECLIQETKLNEDDFKPESTATNGSVHQEQKKKRRNYKIRQNIFNGKTFAILEESFIVPERKDDDEHIVQVQEFVQGLEKKIIENSGRVIDQAGQAMFLIMQDGFDEHIWDAEPEDDQVKIHPRFIEQCCKHKAMLSTDSALHLQPLPQRIPCAKFSGICIEFAMVNNELDLLVFSCLVNLFGIKKSWKE